MNRKVKKHFKTKGYYKNDTYLKFIRDKGYPYNIFYLYFGDAFDSSKYSKMSKEQLEAIIENAASYFRDVRNSSLNRNKRRYKTDDLDKWLDFWKFKESSLISDNNCYDYLLACFIAFNKSEDYDMYKIKPIKIK